MTRFVLIAVLASSIQVQAANLSNYFNDAKGYGSTFNPGIMNTAKDAAAAPTILPMYGTTSPEAALMGSGKMSVAPQSTTKVTDCEFNPADPDRYKRQECEAINFWRKNPTVRPQYTISRSTDPVVTRTNAVRANPQAFTGPMPTMTGSYSGCQTTNTGGTPITEIETCEETAIIESKTCVRTREVEVDADFDYECKASQKKINYPSCNKSLHVTVNVSESCTHGTWVVNAGSLGGAIRVDAYCDHSNKTSIQLRFVQIWSSHGICANGFAYVPKAPFTVQADNQFRADHSVFCHDYENCILTHNYINILAFPAAHWKGHCTVSHPLGYAIGNQGCNGDICTYSFRTYEAGPAYLDYAGGSTHSSNYAPRWGWGYYYGTATAINPRQIVTESDSWDNQCAPLEARE